MEKFFDDDSLKMTTASKEKARRYILTAIKNEHSLQIISNRHLDSIILMCLYLGTRFDQLNHSLRMKDMANVYQTHPHCIQDVSLLLTVGSI